MELLLYDEYASVCEAQRALLGSGRDALLLLFQVGSFWEMYDCDAQRGSPVRRVCALLDIQATRRNKAVAEVSRTNPELAGFPVLALRKYLPALLDAGLTVVLAEQQQLPPGTTGRRLPRRVTRVLSRGTWLPDEPLDVAGEADAPPQGLSNGTAPVLACLHYCAGEGCGAAFLELATGRSSVMEAHGASGLECSEMAGPLASMRPMEVLITGDDMPRERYEALRAALLSADPGCLLHVEGGGRPRAEFARLAYQEQVLRKAFPDTGLMSAVEFAGLEMLGMARAAFVALLDFTHRHDERLVLRLPAPPDLLEGAGGDGKARAVHVPPSVFADLDVLLPPGAAGPGRALADVLVERCATRGGRRLLMQRLLRPSADALVLQARYDATDALLEGGLHQAVRARLKGACDLERMWRRVTLQQGRSLACVPSMRGSLQRVLDAASACPGPALATVLNAGHLRGGVEEHSEAGGECLQEHATAVLGALAEVDDDGRISPGVFPDLDEARERMHGSEHVAHEWVARVRKVLHDRAGDLGTRPEWVRTPADCAVGVPWALVCTARRFLVVRRALLAGGTFSEDEIILDAQGDEGAGTVRFTHPKVQQAASAHGPAALQLKDVEQARAVQLEAGWAARHTTQVLFLARAAAMLDLHATAAEDAAENALCRPLVESGPSGLLDCRGLRHPLVERAKRAVPYVANDVALCGQGLLLYGVNAAGKSCLCKAVALAVLMAQAGLHVACASMRLAPFDCVLTRMASRDDIHRARSTFMVEVLELRDALSRAGRRTLLVGDELCSGTESASATALVGSACLRLLDRGAAFVFATHLHELARVSLLREETRLQVRHLGVRYDAGLDALVYERELREGQGEAVYGLEVARALHLDAALLDTAHAIRREVMDVAPSFVRPRASRYNRAVYVDVCGACGQRSAEEVHHIVPQRLAGPDGMLPPDSHPFHKDVQHNLVPLCGPCHDAVHAGKIEIQGRVQTTRGVQLLTKQGGQ